MYSLMLGQRITRCNVGINRGLNIALTKRLISPFLGNFTERGSILRYGCGGRVSDVVHNIMEAWVLNNRSPGARSLAGTMTVRPRTTDVSIADSEGLGSHRNQLIFNDSKNRHFFGGFLVCLVPT